jgi:hypothetical protein
MPVGSTPPDLVSAAADAAFTAIDTHLAHADAACTKALILLEIEGQPTGEAHQVVAGHNVEDAKDLIAMLAAHFVAACDQIGIKVDLMPVQRFIQG